jgi:hypothetical protein
MKPPALALGISVGAVVIGSSVCYPGICGCVSWLSFKDPDKIGTPFLWITLAGVVGILASIIWWIMSAFIQASARPR